MLSFVRPSSEAAAEIVDADHHTTLGLTSCAADLCRKALWR